MTTPIVIRVLVFASVAAASGGSLVAPARAPFSFLSAYLTVLSTLVGVALFVMITHLCGATWITILRRRAEVVMSTLPLAALGVLPLLLWVPSLYEWQGDLSELSAHHRELVEKKQSWLTVGFFSVRSVLYVLIPSIMSELLYRASLRQDRNSEGSIRAMVRLSAWGLVLVSLCLTLLAFDWIMTLDPVWYSNIYGVYLFSGGVLGAMALVSALAATDCLGATPQLGVTREHLSACGRLLFGFVCFWAYIAFSQALLIWIADLPEEVGWYVDRTAGGWEVVTWVLIAGHFLAPFFFLLPRRTKERPRLLLLASAWVLAFHFVDCFYQVLPALLPGRFSVHWLDLAMLLALVGVVYEAARFRCSRAPNVPICDPRLKASLAYRRK